MLLGWGGKRERRIASLAKPSLKVPSSLPAIWGCFWTQKGVKGLLVARFVVVGEKKKKGKTYGKTFIIKPRSLYPLSTFTVHVPTYIYTDSMYNVHCKLQYSYLRNVVEKCYPRKYFETLKMLWKNLQLLTLPLHD